MPLRSGKLGTADYYLIRQKPAGAHRRYRIMRGIKLPNGKVVHETIRDERLDQINAAFLAPDKPLSPAAADQAVMDLMQRLYKERDAAKPIPVFHNDNVKVLESFWKRQYGSKKGELRSLKSPNSARAAFERAIRALGNLSLLTASKEEMRDALELEAGLRIRVSEDTPRQLAKEAERRAKKSYSTLAGRLNQLLKGIGRDIELPRGTIPRPLIYHIAQPELQKLLAEISDADMRTLVTVAFGSGMRCGEIFGYDPEDVQRNGQRIYVEEQLKFQSVREAKESGRPRFFRAELKNGKPHHTFVLPFARQAVLAWLEVPTEKREKLRVARLAETVEEISKRLWPDNPVKHIGFHDLRHCYAIHCLSTLGLNLTTVATFLGDNYQTVEMYYGGWVMTDEGFERCEQIAQAAEASK